MRLSLILLAATALCAGATPAPADPATGAVPLKVIGHIQGPDGRWDLASFDPEHRRVYVAHSDVVLALDVDKGVLNPAFAPGDHLHAAVAAPGAGVVVTTNSGDNSVRILRASDGTLVKSLPVAADADGAVFDPATGLVVVVNGEPGLLTLVDPVNAVVVGTINVGGALELATVDGKGRAYVNIESAGAVAVIDLKARSVLARYPMAGCTKPTGIAYVQGDRVISSCNSGMAKILDAASGRQIASLAIGPHPDSVLYDPQRSLAFIPTGGDGMLSVIALAGPADNTVIATVPTQAGARSGAVDPTSGRVYLPTAEMMAPAHPGDHPAVKPGTFQILVVGR